jgi:23S rRNA (uracil1939-C5)-methyltransferase
MSKTPFTKITVEIEKLNSKGFGVGLGSKSVTAPLCKIEVPHTAPGDVVEVEIGRKHAGAFFGYFPKVISSSKHRVALRCAHAAYCGGCSWQQISYPEQVNLKNGYIRDLFTPHFSDKTSLLPIIECEDPWLYRNKMEYTFNQNKAGEKFLGLIMTGGKGRVFNLTECHLTHPWFQDSVNAIRSFWEQSSILAYNMRSNQGTLRTLTLRKGLRTNDRLAMITVSGAAEYALKKKDIDGIVGALLSVVPQEEHGSYSIFIRVQQISKGSATQFFEMNVHGPDYLKEELLIGDSRKNFSFKISPTAFFQPNTLQAEKLYNKAVEMASNKLLWHVLDLYAGTSTLGILFSSKAKMVTSIEINPHATFDAEVNKEWNHVENLRVIKGDVGLVLAELRKDADFHPDVVVVDPPRAGLDDNALKHILELKPNKIIYISCNPKTQADNVGVLLSGGYQLILVQPVDQFPHTIHVENICLLEKFVD